MTQVDQKALAAAIEAAKAGMASGMSSTEQIIAAALVAYEGVHAIPAPAESEMPEPVELADTCDGIEQDAFEAWALTQGYDMHQHPMHYLFMAPKTDAARKGWKAGISHARSRALATVAALVRERDEARDLAEERRMTIALLRQQPAVAVKPLEWGERRAIHDVNWAWDAKTSIDWYVVATASGEGCKGTHYWFVAGDTIKGWAMSEEEAKAAAQADYEQRIRSAIAPPQAPGVEVTEGLRERAARAVALSTGLDWDAIAEEDEKNEDRKFFRMLADAALQAALGSGEGK